MVKLSDNFSLEEFLWSETADRLGIDNAPPQEAIANMSLLCQRVLELLRLMVGSRPVKVTSGYRCLALNRAIGSGDSSQHILGEAADLHIIGVKDDDVFNTIYDMEHYDQVIREFPPGGWVHVSYKQLGGRRNALVANRNEQGKTVFTLTGKLV